MLLKSFTSLLDGVLSAVEQVSEFVGHLGAALTTKNDLVLENLALRQQLAAYKRQKAKPTIREMDRIVLATVSSLWNGWKDSVFIVQPQTVIKWFNDLSRFWFQIRNKMNAKPKGRPRVTKEIIEAIRMVSRMNPDWGAPKIWRELNFKLGIKVGKASVAKYMIKEPPPPSKNWRIFMENHADEIWGIDFLVQTTATFEQIYVFTIKQLGSREIIHLNATKHPTLDWVKQQIKHATWDHEKPRFLLHDNDAIFGNYPNPVTSNGKKYWNHLDRWLKETMGISGIRTPYRSPRANSVVERFNRTLREECLNHFLFFSVGHIQRVLQRYKTYFNENRIHQGIERIPSEKSGSSYVTEKPASGKIVAIPHLGGLVHDFRWAA